MTLKTSIVDRIFEHADRTPDKLAVADPKRELSYRQLSDRIRAVAGFLQDKGVRKGDVVGIRAIQSAEFVAAFYGAQVIGAVACPVEKTAAKERTETVLSKVKAKCILDITGYDYESTDTYLISDAFQFENGIENAELLDDGTVADIIFTTGTTGDSKGILVTRRTDVAIAENVVDSVEMKEDEVELITSPTSHSLAIRRLNAGMYLGSTVILTDNFLLYGSFWGLIEKYKVTAITLVPAILKIILEAFKDKLGEYDAQLNYIQLGSAPLHEELMNRLIGMLQTTRLYNTYGATESGCTLIYEFSKYGMRKGCIGRTTVNTKLFFTDKNRTAHVDATDEASAGYLAFAGEMNMLGYLNDPEKTSEVLKDGVIYTNDIGYRGADGLVYLLGRDGEVINSGGLKISPVEVEEVAGRIEGIADCACVPMADERRGEVPKLFIVVDKAFDGKLENADIKKFLKQYLEDYKIPVKIERIDSIPRTFNGKIIRKQLM